MAIKNVLQWPDDHLLHTCERIINFDESILQLKEDLIETCKFEQAQGLAANQIGVNKTAFVMKYAEGYLFVANPFNTEFVGEKILQKEGCLSFKDAWTLVRRYPELKSKYLDELGVAKDIHLFGVDAQCYSHESEHLVGKTMLDSMDTYRREPFLKMFRTVQRKSRFL